MADCPKGRACWPATLARRTCPANPSRTLRQCRIENRRAYKLILRNQPARYGPGKLPTVLAGEGLRAKVGERLSDFLKQVRNRDLAATSVIFRVAQKLRDLRVAGTLCHN